MGAGEKLNRGTLQDGHSRLLQWAKEQGVKINRALPAKIPGKGLGVVAERDIKQGETLIFVPARVLLTVNPNVSKPERGLPSELSIHGRLAIALVFPLEGCLRSSEEWRCIMPNQVEMKEVMPVAWPQPLQDLLPPAAQSLLEKSRHKLENDFRLASQVFLPNLAAETHQTLADLQEQFKYGWLLVNTRCFYWDYPVLFDNLDNGSIPPTKKKKSARSLKVKKWPRDDCMALCPVIDYFNHADDEGCSVSYNAEGFTVTANRNYESGEELTVSYGKHSNDFLMVEYGFTMFPNSSDYIILDSVIIPRFSLGQKKHLEDENLLGNYTFFYSTNFSSSTCHRTQCALRLLLLSDRQWQRFVSGASDGEKEQEKVNTLCKDLLQQYLREIRENIGKLGEIEGDGLEGARMSLQRRWSQVEEMITHALADNVEN